MLKNKQPLSELSQVMQIFPQILISVDVNKRKDISQIPAISNQIQKAENKLKGKGRVVVRPSGTEAKIRVMVEGEDEGEIKLIAEELAGVIKHNLD
jgi:phosphoglucosamine mutase